MRRPTQNVRLQVSGKLRGNFWSLNKTKIKNEKIVFSDLFFSYWQLKIGYSIPAYEQTSLHERWEISLSSGAYSDPQTERHIGNSLPRTSRTEEDYDIQRRKRPLCKLNIKPGYSNPVTEVDKVNVEDKRLFLVR